MYGHKHGSRCPEVVAALLMDPVRAVPTTAIAFKNLTDIRRVLLRNPRRRENFCVNLELAMENQLDNVHGPASGLFFLAKIINCKIHLEKNTNEISLSCEEAGRSIDLLTPDTPLLKWNLRDFASRAILGGLKER